MSRSRSWVKLRQGFPHVWQQSQQVHVGLLGQEEQDRAADQGAPLLWDLQVRRQRDRGVVCWSRSSTAQQGQVGRDEEGELGEFRKWFCDRTKTNFGRQGRPCLF